MYQSEEEKIKFRSIIEFLFMEGENATTIQKRLVVVYGDKAHPYRTVAWWVEEFTILRERLQDEQRPARPSDAGS